MHPLLSIASFRVTDKHHKQVDVYHDFLSSYGSMYSRVYVSERIWVMLVHAANSSVIERAFSFLKRVKMAERNCLKLRELERLMILGLNLPDDLSEVDLEKIIELM